MTVSRKPSRAAASMSDVAMLLPSPTYTTRCSPSGPHASSRVMRSARIWHGCERSVRALITGFSAASASWTRSVWLRMRATIKSIYRSRTRAASTTDSRRPSCTSCSPSVVVVPPRRAMRTSNETRVLWDGFWKSIAMCLPASGRSVRRPALMSWASPSTERSSADSRSAMSRKSLPRRLATCRDHDAPPGRLEAGFGQLPCNDRRNREVAGGIELRKLRAQSGIVSQSQYEVAARRRLQAELCGPEPEWRFVAQADRQAVGDADLRPRVRVGQRDGFHEVPQSPHLVAALDDDDAIAEEAEPARRPGKQLQARPDRDHPRPDRTCAEGDAGHPALRQAGGDDGEEAGGHGTEQAGSTESHHRPARPDVDHRGTPTEG